MPTKSFVKPRSIKPILHAVKHTHMGVMGYKVVRYSRGEKYFVIVDTFGGTWEPA